MTTRPVPPARLRLRLPGWELLLVGLLVLTVIVGSRLSDQLLTGSNLSNLTANFVEIALMALPLTLIVVAAEIDLSVASILGLSSAVLGKLWSLDVPMPLALIAAMAVGGAAGAVNGLLVTRLRLPSLAVTIGTLALYRGLAYGVLGDAAVANFPSAYTDLGFNNLGHTFVPIPFAVFLVLAALVAVLLHATPFGRSVFAAGSNEVAARFSGVRVERLKLTLYVLSGLFSALAGIVYTFRFSSARADNGTGFELSAVTAVLLGGVSIFGGRGSIFGVIVSLFLIGTLNNALTLVDVSNEVLTVVTGLLLVLSVFGTNLLERARQASERRRAALAPREEAA